MKMILRKMFKEFMRFAWQIIWKFLISEYYYDYTKTHCLYDLMKFGKDVTNFWD